MCCDHCHILSDRIGEWKPQGSNGQEAKKIKRIIETHGYVMFLRWELRNCVNDGSSCIACTPTLN